MHNTAMTVCRSFAFINLNIPPQINPAPELDDRFACNYVTIGFFDGMKTDLLELPDDNQRSLAAMWYYNEKLALAMDGRHSFQSTFGFRNVDPDEDRVFWSYETIEKYPLTFVTFLQMQPKEEGDYVPLQERLLDLERKLKATCDAANPDYIVACYATLDKNDYIVCIKSKRYASIAPCILELHRVDFPQKILYSYSVFSLNWHWINELGKDPSIFESDEKIDSICLKGIANSYTEGNLSEKYQKLCHVLDTYLFPGEMGFKKSTDADSKLYDILGDYDFRYIARDVPLKQLLRAIAHSNGALHYDGVLFRFALFSSSLVLNTLSGTFTYQGDNYEKECAEVERMKRNLNWPMCQDLMNWLMPQNVKLSSELSKQSALQTLEHSAYLTNFVSLWKLLSSLAALERAPTRKYDFHSLFWPFRMLLQFLMDSKETAPNQLDDRDEVEASWNDDRNLYGFIHGLSSTLHGTLRTDIQFFQINDFNAIVHYAPAKLRAFYSAWVYKLTECCQLMPVNERKKQYEFMVVPNTYTVIRTYEFHLKKSTCKDLRLMRIEIPERFIYQPNLVCIYLAHEVAHFVGSEIRCRSKRHYVFLEILGNVILTQYCSEIVALLLKENDEDLKELSKAFIEFTNRTQDNWREDINLLLVKTIGEDILNDPYLHSSDFVSIITKTLDHVLGSPATDLNPNTDDQRSNRTKVDHVIRDIYASFLAEIHSAPERSFPVDSLRYLERSVTRITNGEYAEMLGSYLTPKMENSILGVILTQMKEVQADIFSIFMLRLNPEKYVHGFLKSGLIPNNSYKTLLTHRLFAVFSTLKSWYKTNAENTSFLSSDWQAPFTSSDCWKGSSDKFYEFMKKIQGYSDNLYYSLCTRERTLPVMTKVEVNSQDELDAYLWGGRGYFALHSSFTVDKFAEYLKECIQQFISRFENEKVHARHQKILDAFVTLNEKPLLEQADTIDNLLFEFESSRQADWDMISGDAYNTSE